MSRCIYFPLFISPLFFQTLSYTLLIFSNQTLTHHPSDPHRLGHGSFRRRCLLKESLPHPRRSQLPKPRLRREALLPGWGSTWGRKARYSVSVCFPSLQLHFYVTSFLLFIQGAISPLQRPAAAFLAILPRPM